MWSLSCLWVLLCGCASAALLYLMMPLRWRGRVHTIVRGCFARVVLPWVLEPLLSIYLRRIGPRSIQRHWRKQLEETGDCSDFTDPPLGEKSETPKTDDASVPERAGPQVTHRSPTVVIQLATQRHHGAIVKEIADAVNAAYVRELKDALVSGDGDSAKAFSRTYVADIQRRLLSEAEMEALRSNTMIANRVLFLAVDRDDGAIVVVTPQRGVGAQLVDHCEQYLRLAMLEKARIEYFHIEGHPSSERLRQWYETRLGYKCFKSKDSAQSYRGNEVKGQVLFRHCDKSIMNLAAGLRSEAPSGTPASDIIEARKRRMASFLLGKGD